MFQFKSGRDLAGRPAYLGRQPVLGLKHLQYCTLKCVKIIILNLQNKHPLIWSIGKAVPGTEVKSDNVEEV